MRLPVLTPSFLVVALIMNLICSVTAMVADPLPSWNNGNSRQAIVDFVTAVAAEDGKDYVPSEERIATFDNDGTLWVEYPVYTQALFAFDRVNELAPQHSEWKTRQPFRGILEGDMKAVGATGMRALWKLSWQRTLV